MVAALLALALVPAAAAAQSAREVQSPVGARAARVVAPEVLTSYETDIGDFHVKLESGTATKGYAGYKLSGGAVSVWRKSDPSRKLTFHGADFDVGTSNNVTASMAGAFVALGCLLATADVPYICTVSSAGATAADVVGAMKIASDANEILIEMDKARAHGVELLMSLKFKGGALSGEGGAGDGKEAKHTLPDGTKVVIKNRRVTAKLDSGKSPPLTLNFEGDGLSLMMRQGGNEVTVPGAPHVSVSADGDGKVTLPLPGPADIVGALDVNRQAREACVAAARKLPEAGGARDKAVGVCNTSNPMPTPPAVPPSVKVKISDLMQ